VLLELLELLLVKLLEMLGLLRAVAPLKTVMAWQFAPPTAVVDAAAARCGPTAVLR
jgi:hypothetical protein